MEEIKEGDYIRTIKGNICKVLRVREKHRFITSSGHPSVTPERYFVDNNKQYSISKPYVKKHSKNIIDLIEEGDYVNGEKVCKSRYDELYTSYVYCGGIGVRTTEAYTTFIKDMKEEEIETIVTKQQFENMEYKVEEQ